MDAAIQYGNTLIVKELMPANPKPSSENTEELKNNEIILSNIDPCAIFKAIRDGHNETVIELLKISRIADMLKNNTDALRIAIENNNMLIVQKLLQYMKLQNIAAGDNNELLRLAAKLKNVAATTELLKIPRVYDALYRDYELLQTVCELYNDNVVHGVSTDESFAILAAYKEYCDAAELIPIAQGEESSMNDKRVQLALTTFNETVKPGVKGDFQKPGENLDECLIKTETAIRKMLLEHMSTSFKKDIQNVGITEDEKLKKDEIIEFINKNLAALCKAEPKAMTQARKYFTSNSNTTEIAWRCYDSGAENAQWDNLFVTHKNDNGAPIFSTAASHTGTGNLSLTEGTNLIREMAAQYFLYICNETDEETRQSMLDNFVFCLAEIRRAHNNSSRNGDIDSPSCFPGTIGRFSWILNKEEKPKLTKLEIIREYCTNKIFNKIQQHMTQLTNNPHQTRLFIDAIIALNHKEALNIIANKGKVTSGYEICMYNAVHNKIRQEFLVPLLSDAALDEMKLELNGKLYEIDQKAFITPGDRAYVKLVLRSIAEKSMLEILEPVIINKFHELDKQEMNSQNKDMSLYFKQNMQKIKERSSENTQQPGQHNIQ